MKFRELEQRDEAVRAGDAQARRAMNALAMTSGIVSALIQHPGAKGDHQSMVEGARAMLRSADETTSELLTGLRLDVVPWARFRIMRMVSLAVSEHWIATARATGKPSAEVRRFLPVWRELASHEMPAYQFDEPADDDRVALQIAVLDALQPVMREISVFALFHDELSAAMHARETILAAVEPALEELLPETVTPRSRKQLQQALLRNAGSLYASAWRRHAQDLVDRLSSLNVKEQEAAVARHPKGFPLDEVDNGFRASFTKLAEMASYLAEPAPAPAAESASLSQEVDGDPDLDSYEAPQWTDDGSDLGESEAERVMHDGVAPNENDGESLHGR